MESVVLDFYSSEAAIEIPDDLWIEILARVPSNLVLKFRGLSKFHRDLINSPNFIEKHYDLSHKTSSSSSYVLFSSYEKNYWVKKVDLSNSDAIVLHRLIPPHGKYECVGCFKGILLLRSPECMVLWNPLTGASRSFPHVRRPDEFISYVVGVTTDLKILKIVQRSVNLTDTKIECEIYSSKSDIWRKVIKTNHQLKLNLIRSHSGAAFVEGTNSVHMLATESETSDFIITVFDFSAEKFNRVFHLPPGARRSVHISSLDGCLCVYSTPSMWTYDGVLKVWLMKEYGVMESWEQLQIDIRIQIDSPIHILQLDFVNDGRQTLIILGSGVQFYDLEEKKLKKKKVSFVEPLPVWPMAIQCFEYTPSLRRV